MRHAVFIGEYELTIDDKNRLLVPSDVRKSMEPKRDGEGFYLIIGPNRKPWFYAERYYDELLARETESLRPEAEIRPDPQTLEVWQATFAMASRVAWDKQGRVLIPEATLRRTGTIREVTLIGVRNHLELWNRSDWEDRFNQLLGLNGT
jgi:MraZ protein